MRVVAVLAVLVLSFPACGEDLIAQLDGTRKWVHVVAPWVTPEVCDALQRAENRIPWPYLITQPPTIEHPVVCDLHHTLYYYADAIPEAFVIFDHSGVAEGPDIEHLTYSSERERVEQLTIRYSETLIAALDRKAALKRR